MNAELTRALAFQRYRNLAYLERAGAKIMTHTPGPWRVVDEGFGWNVRSDKGCVFARDYAPEANANLIEAAPDMLAQLRNALDCWECENMLTDAMVAKMRAAIAKAEGRL
jgi:hypothetical protein